MIPAELLEGKIIGGKWKVVKRIIPPATATGGAFSTAYIVQDESGRKAFLKAMDYVQAFAHVDHIKALNELTSAYLFEKNICEKCRERHLDRVVHAIGSFTEQPNPANALSKVECLIFELADGDIRAHLAASNAFDLAFALRSLHHVGTALRQLHSVDIAHQDLKPSNVLVFGKQVGVKVSDFGRSWSKDMRAAHDNLRVAGDYGYAPPELLYGYIPPDFGARRFGCDLYLLGSLGAFLLTTANMNSLIIKNLDAAHYPFNWGGTYAAVLPYLQDAYSLSLGELCAATVLDFRQEVVELLSYLCQPDPGKRGHPLNRLQNQFSLERFISAFDRLAQKAEIKMAGGGI